MEDEIIYDFTADPEYSWLVRTCLNAFNVSLTILHLTICDYIRELRMEDDIFSPDILSYPLFMVAVDILMYVNS